MTRAGTETRDVSIGKPGEPVTDWQPWRNCSPDDTAEQTALLALGRYLRAAGYTRAPGAPAVAFEPFELAVYVVTPRDIRHDNGRPLTCTGFTVRVGPER